MVKTLTLILFIFSSLNLFAGSVAISYQAKKKPAKDLVYEGNVISSDEVIDLESHGIDTSKLDPKKSDVWCHECANNQVAVAAFNQANFYNLKPSVSGMFRFSVKVSDKIYNVVASLDNHGALLRHALLKKLKYQLDPIRYQNKLEIKFNDLKEKETFLNNLADYTLTARERWIVENPANEARVVLQDLVVEPGRITLPQFHWGIIKRSIIDDRRALRALVVPFVLGDIGESINLYSWDIGRVVSQSVLLTHPYADEFEDTSIQDLRWGARKLAELNKNDLKQIVDSAFYPQDVAALILEKITARRNELVKLSKLKTEFSIYPYDTKITVGNVKKGKLEAETYPGYAIRFKYENPESPLRFSELVRYFVVKGLGSALSYASKFASDFLGVDAQEGLENQKRKEIESFINFVQAHPGEAYQVPVKAYGFPTYGANINLNRDIVSGTYYGSEYPIQLVDSIGIGVNLGYFEGLSGLKGVTPGVNANIQLARNYIHLRPIDSIKTGLKTNWGKIFVPFHMNKLLKVLDENPTCLVESTPCNQDGAEDPNKDLNEFLSQLNKGEMFMVTDNLNLGGLLNVNVPVLALMGLPARQFSVGLSAGMSSLWLKKIIFEKTEEGIKVNIMYNHAVAETLGVNVNFLLTLFSHQTTWKQGDAKTKFYNLKLDNISADKAKKVITAIRGVFKKNNTEFLEANFSHYYLKDDFHSRLRNNKILFYQWDKMRIKHEVIITPPVVEGKSYDPTKHNRTLYHEKAITRLGYDWTGFLGNVAKFLWSGNGQSSLSSRPNENPANRPFGSGHTLYVSTEGELTANKEFRPMTIVEDIYSSWTINNRKLNRLFDKLDEKLANINLERNLINRDIFNSTKSIQLFELRSTLILYEKALQALEKGIFHKNELQAYNLLVSFIGLDEFKAWCSQVKDSDNGDMITYQGEQYHFDCVTPAMAQILTLRKNGNASLRKDKIHLYNEINNLLFRNFEMDKIINYVGNDNVLFLVKVSGFRKGDEAAFDQEGKSEYVSDTIGKFNKNQGAGIFRDFISDYGISSYQINASFFSEGF